jgi:phosphinothricin acetyltransferase
MMIRPLLYEHWPAVRRIYEEGIETGQATFETSAPEWEAFDVNHTPDCRLVTLIADGAAGIDNRVAGWAALVPFSKRTVYRGVGEASVYIAAAERGKGVGTELLRALIGESEQRGYWTLLAKIFPENESSMALVRKHGFREVGRLCKIAQHKGHWRDVVLLERRVGVSPG